MGKSKCIEIPDRISEDFRQRELRNKAGLSQSPYRWGRGFNFSGAVFSMGAQMQQARVLHQGTAEAARLFTDFAYKTRNRRSCARRVVAKAEYLDKGENPRFVVTSLTQDQWSDQALCEQFYCARGEMENRIKEQMCQFADRLSTDEMKGNQLRLYFSALPTP